MFRWSVGLTVATAALLALLAPTASARECPGDWINRLVVNGQVKAGQPFTIGYGIKRPQQVDDFTVTVDGVTYPLTAGEEESVKVRAPRATGVFDISFAWRTPDCDGSATWGAISVPRSAKFGATEGTRVDGLWRVQMTPRKVNLPKIRVRWRMRPKCDYYACNTIVTGRGERYDTAMWRDMYVDNVNAGSAACYTRTGQEVPGGYHVGLQQMFWVAGDEWIGDTVATRANRIQGETTVEFELTRRGRFAGCRGQTIVYTLRGVRVGN
ncbi:hypothetical protein Q5424_11360 [Conexibacter sp. JD483]|uniref:hypothetical protein n=1 Tax=unclassified Conexibacter TaxID=2627773 RepID=UPI0027261714|nr:MULTISPECIES: hypothetical protein [unclassified Conexibacter]MDO8187906.1 hypothetical protein [Conexibacter sp. CPCC 205706]MDO8198643.1 hypothetical protein [Conexibacter sp. CPCC 205762]MDR9369683.1 hypothetical protein [Conexibacter sp. JD483]